MGIGVPPRRVSEGLKVRETLEEQVAFFVRSLRRGGPRRLLRLELQVQLRAKGLLEQQTQEKARRDAVT